ncbi:TetR/AcrR family transcriptional regulator [Bizionia gelidisalsuginis]|uniref:TetR/AcrR family transcriptional regulator n=1 Tax=Bizionia gelidisalsuginis TaxID=291188 RepID=A0ABY3M9X3_9FLAO|nr:TetR/AcrR family transcriptional regulator [Bizionia gelidisalsuginis]TYC12088.1 TetR/AcrR family transcriptional regulator [Bizionia gelidisalsuginis]
MDKKQRIILTMLELVVDQGVHATPMSQVAREANVAVGTIYHYFKNKNEIIEEIYSMICRDFGVVLIANMPDEDFKKQYEAIWLNMFYYFTENPLAFEFMEHVAVPPIITPEIRLKNVQHFVNIRDFMLSGILQKKLKHVPLRLIVQMAFGTVISAARLKFKKELPMSDIQVREALKMSWDCIKI